MGLAQRTARAAAGLGSDVARVARRDRMLYAIALTVCATGFAMQPWTGLRPDWDVVRRVFVKLGIVGARILCKSFVLMRVRRTPLRDERDTRSRTFHFFQGLGEDAGIVLRQPVGKERGGDANGQTGATVRDERSGPEPRVKAMTVDFRLDAGKDLVPNA